MTPDFDILIDGASIKGRINDRLLELTVSDAQGQESDTCQILIDDRDQALAIPRKGAQLSVSLGYVETGLVHMGLFTVDEVTLSGNPREMSISAKAADMRESLKEQKTRSFEKKSLGDIIGEIAGNHNLRPAVSSELASRVIPYLGQTEESDLHLVTRLAKDHGAVFKVANGAFLFTAKSAGQSASGQTMGTVVISPANCKEWSATLQDRPRHKEVKAHWHDRDKGERTTETQGGTGGDAAFMVRHDLPSKDEAQWQAEARAGDLARAEGSLDATLIGDPSIAAEKSAVMRGLRAGIDGIDWTITNAEHSYSSGGYTTSITAELKA
ncbi:phage late control D family protein [Aestuariivirga sp. YIM B02566]|uniref:Uncharacterized protein n=1 Tax=Taklimakanibacter albus TaxID=2800327 RepID=A0ACC5R6I6_9HYPH|nr:contractile injection system protein, VgrG/Pvc8 family [Aestuariivirga sp. YIM B02566]MBK1868242.1 hypothetical protein [Aestuariivirga sp. YIM B02566]